MALHSPPKATASQEDWRPRHRASRGPAVREALVAGDLRVTQKAPAEILNSYAQEWLRGLQSNLKASTVRFYRENLTRHVLPLLGDRPLANIARADGRLLITTSREKGLRLNTVNS